MGQVGTSEALLHELNGCGCRRMQARLLIKFTDLGLDFLIQNFYSLTKSKGNARSLCAICIDKQCRVSKNGGTICENYVNTFAAMCNT